MIEKPRERDAARAHPWKGWVGWGERENYWLEEGAPKERNSPGRGMTVRRRVAYGGESA